MKLNRSLVAALVAGLLSTSAFAQSVAITPGGVVNAADYSRDLAPGAIVSIFGTNLATSVQSATQLPLPTQLAGVSVEAGTGGSFMAVPLFFVSPKQINAQVPYTLQTGSAQIRVRVGTAVSTPEPITIAARAPKFFTFDFTGLGGVVAQTADYKTISESNPAKPADTLVLYLNSAGTLDRSIVEGAAAPGASAGSVPARITDAVTVTVNGQNAPVSFAGLAPGFSGLYQVNAKMPFVAITGPLDIQLQIAGNNTPAVSTQSKVFMTYRQLGYYFALLGGKPVPSQSMNAAAGGNSAVAFRQNDQVTWGTEGFQAWSKNTGLGTQYNASAGEALTLKNGSAIVYDNNGIENGSYGSFYDNTNGGDNALKPGLANVFSMSNYFPLVFASDVKLTQRTTITEIIAYFDGNGNFDLPFDPQNPYLKYRMNIWSNTTGNAPMDTKSYVGNIFTSDSAAGAFTISDTGVNRTFADAKTPGRNVPDPIYRLDFKLSTPLTLEAGDYWFSHDASVRQTPSNTSSSSSIRFVLTESRKAEPNFTGAVEGKPVNSKTLVVVRPTAPVNTNY